MSGRDGGPAFPRPLSTDEHHGPCSVFPDQEGMTLRDYFAAKAMQALINANGEPLDRLSEVPEYAYQIADAMLAAREAQP